jgi:3-phenylpropionate/cinnamic acid dioxygenase small subunit
MSTDSAAWARLTDRVEINDLLIRYAVSLDSRDWAQLATCFTEDAVADYGELAGQNDCRDDIVATCRHAVGGLDASQHFVGNFVIASDGDVATASSYLHAQHYLVSASGTNTFVGAGTYYDRLIRSPLGWRITHRRLEVTWTDGNAGIFAEAAARFDGANGSAGP